MEIDLRSALMIGNMLVTLGIAVYSWSAQRRAANAAEVADLSRRLVVTEERIGHMPNSGLVNALHSDMRAVQARLDGIQQALQPLSASLDRINNYLLNHK